MNQVKDVKPNNIIVLDSKINNIKVEDKKPNNQIKIPAITDQLYTVVLGAGMYMGLPYLLTYPEAGTVITPYTK